MKTAIALCKGGTVVDGACRHCRALAQQVPPPKVVEVAIPAEIPEAIQQAMEVELLPEGEWPKEVSDEAPETETKIRQYFLDHSRLAFLQELSSTKIVDVKPLGLSKYEGVVVRSENGRLIALIDCPIYRNALYIFSAENNGWVETAKLTKYQLRTNRPPEFLRKIRHSGDWQNRVKNFLLSV